MVALLGDNTLISVASYAEPRPKKLASLPGLPDDEVHSWAIIPPDHTLSRSVEVLLSVGTTVYVVDATEAEDRFLDIGPFAHISVSPDGQYINLYGVNGKAHIVSSDFQERIFEHDSDSKTPPLYVEWCGTDPLIAWEDEVHIIGPGDISSSYIYDSTRVHVISGEQVQLPVSDSHPDVVFLQNTMEHGSSRMIFASSSSECPRIRWTSWATPPSRALRPSCWTRLPS